MKAITICENIYISAWRGGEAASADRLKPRGIPALIVQLQFRKSILIEGETDR